MIMLWFVKNDLKKRIGLEEDGLEDGKEGVDVLEVGEWYSYAAV